MIRVLILAALLLLIGCGEGKDKGLVIVLHGQNSTLPEKLSRHGYKVVHMHLPCNGDLECWAANAPKGDFVAPFLKQMRQEIRYYGMRRVMVVGVSRGGYLALRSAELLEVTDILVMSPVTDLQRLQEFQTTPLPLSYALQPSAVAQKRVFLQIGSDDKRVGTDVALNFARDVMLADGDDFTLNVRPTPGHTLPPEYEAFEWACR